MRIGQLFPFVNQSDPVDPLLNRKIVVEPAGIGTMLDTNLTNDVLPTLLQMTGQAFTVASSSSLVGVARVRVVGSLSKREYRIQGGLYSDVLIEGGGWRACQYGLYAWLAELGAEQLAPGDRWRVIPVRADLRLSLGIRRSSALATFSWTAQGTVSGNRWPAGGATPTFHIDKWQDFHRWNGRPLAHCVGTGPENQAFAGHTDPFAYSARKAEFDADDEHFALHSPPWLPNTVYALNDEVTCNGHKYTCSGPGTSAGSGGPTGTGAAIADNTAVWSHDNIFCGAGGAPHSERRVGAGVFHMTHGGPGGVDTPGDYTTQAGLRTIYAEYVTDTIDTNWLGALPTHPEIADLLFGVGASVADGAKTCADYKCRDNLRGEFSINKDASGADLEAIRAGKIYAIAKAARPNVEFELTLYKYDRQSVPATDGYAINPNLRFLHAPYAFAVDGLPANLSIERTAARRDLDGFKYGIYDYWALTTFVFSNATFPSSIAWSRLRKWLGVGADTVTTESTFSVGAIAPQIWGALQMSWRGSNLLDSDLLASWCSKAFGAGESNVLRMLTRWWGREWPTFVAHAYELGLAFDDLEQADVAVVGDAAARPRVAAMQAYLLYLHYVFRWFDYSQKLPPPPLGDPDATSAVEDLLVFTWRTAHTIMVDAKWVQDVVIASSWLQASFVAQWAVPVDESQWAAWRASNGIVPYTDAEIRTKFEAVRATYPILTTGGYTPAIETALVTPGVPSGAVPITHNSVSGNEGPSVGHEYIFQVAPVAAGVLRIEGFATSTPAAIRFRLYDVSTGALVSQTDVDLPRNVATNHDLDLTVLPVGYYQLFVENARGEVSHRVICRGDLPIVRVGAYNRVIWNPANGFLPRYFFVPKNKTSFHLFSTGPAAQRFYDNTNVQAVITQIAPYVFRITVPAGQDKKIWRWEGNPAGGPGHGTPRLLDIPEWVSPTEAQLIVPTNLWNE